MAFEKKQAGRLVTCTRCVRPTAKGTTQVRRKLVFHFCVGCWSGFRAHCCALMVKIAA